MDEKSRRKIEFEWETRVENEKKQSQQESKDYKKASFTIFASSLSMQAMICLGKIENPLSGQQEENLEQARFLIETLSILKEKTDGNLTSEEEKFLNESLTHLRMHYLETKELKDKPN